MCSISICTSECVRFVHTSAAAAAATHIHSCIHTYTSPSRSLSPSSFRHDFMWRIDSVDAVTASKRISSEEMRVNMIRISCSPCCPLRYLLLLMDRFFFSHTLLMIFIRINNNQWIAFTCDFRNDDPSLFFFPFVCYKIILIEMTRKILAKIIRPEK